MGVPNSRRTPSRKPLVGITANMIFRQIFILLFLTYSGLTNRPADKPLLTSLKISECIENCKDPDKIISESYIDNVYKINFGMLLNCNGQDTISIRFKGDTLKIKVLPTRKSQRVIIEDNGDTTLVTSTAACDCYYKFAAEIKNLPGQPKVISVNKKNLTKS